MNFKGDLWKNKQLGNDSGQNRNSFPFFLAPLMFFQVGKLPIKQVWALKEIAKGIVCTKKGRAHFALFNRESLMVCVS